MRNGNGMTNPSAPAPRQCILIDSASGVEKLFANEPDSSQTVHYCHRILSPIKHLRRFTNSIAWPEVNADVEEPEKKPSGCAKR